jgi:hypothetical protein
MNIDDLETQAEFLAVKQGLLRFVADRYKGLRFELRDCGFHDDLCRSGMDRPRLMHRIDLIGTCGEIEIELKLEIRREDPWKPLIVEQRAPERYTYGMGPTTFARIGHANVEIGERYSITELADLGIDYDSVPRSSPFSHVKDDLDKALVFVVQRLTGRLADLGWQGNRPQSPVEPEKSKIPVRSDRPNTAVVPSGRRASGGGKRGPDLEID